jgi:hypothetical protein
VHILRLEVLFILCVINFCRIHIYADDLQIYHSSSVADLQRCYDDVNTDLKRIND